MSKWIIFACVMSLAGCATAKPTYGPDGKAAYTIECSGTAGSWGMCYRKAGDLCGSSGYKVINQAGDKGLIATGAILTSTQSRSMLVECR